MLSVFDLSAFEVCCFIVFFELDFRHLRYRIVFLVEFDVGGV